MRGLWLLFLFPALLPAQQLDPPATESTSTSIARVAVHGVVLNAASGEPLPRALVRLTGDGSAGTLTDGEGRYELADIPLGPQQFEIIKPGFLDETAEASAAAGGDTRDFAHTVIVAPEMPDVVFKMAPANSIHGQVQLSTGDTAQGIEITLLRQTVQSGRLAWQLVLPGATTTRTNADSAYRFGGLADGTYVVYSAPAMDNESGGPWFIRAAHALWNAAGTRASSTPKLATWQVRQRFTCMAENKRKLTWPSRSNPSMLSWRRRFFLAAEQPRSSRPIGPAQPFLRW